LILKAHSCGERASLLANVKCHKIRVDENFAVRGETFQKMLEQDKKDGLIPFYVSILNDAILRRNSIDSI
jgi:tyrosine decarboxylase